MKLSSLLTVAFVVLKLIGYIDWTWLWVLSPTIIAIFVNTAMITAAYFISTKE